MSEAFPRVALMARGAGKSQALIEVLLAQAKNRGLAVEVIYPPSSDDALLAQVERLTNDLAVTEAQAIDRDEAATTLAQQVERVRALHTSESVQRDLLNGGTWVESQCKHDGRDWPCPTIRALDT